MKLCHPKLKQDMTDPVFGGMVEVAKLLHPLIVCPLISFKMLWRAEGWVSWREFA
jgi:hypothetical protein